MILGIIECGRNKAEWLEDHGGFADWFPPLLDPALPSVEYAVWRADQAHLPSDINECDGWLITGSPYSVYEDRSWQVTLTEFIQQAVVQRPIVGICYGHQHLHHALGGKVEKRLNWGVGVQSYPVVSEPDWLELPAQGGEAVEKFDLIALHQDHVVIPAPNTRVLAGSAESPYAITQIGENVLTFQPHPEMTPAQAALIYALHRQGMGESTYLRATASLEQPRHTSEAARWIGNFLTAKRKEFRP